MQFAYVSTCVVMFYFPVCISAHSNKLVQVQIFPFP